MVGGEHQGPARLRLAVNVDADAEQAAGGTVPVSRDVAAEPQVECQPDDLERQQHQRDCRKRDDDEADPQPGDQASPLSSGTP